jgi:uncharacterized damage-inducible protein DinB
MPEHFLPADISDILTRDLTAMAEEVGSTPETILWVNMPGVTNSVGTLAFHLCGNLQHFIGAALGGSGYIRKREDEFSRKDLSKAELIQEIERAKESITAALSQLTTEDLHKEMPDTPPHHKGRSVGYFLIQLVSHFARHRGQLDYLKRIAIAANS